jgi:hypothetical protein
MVYSGYLSAHDFLLLIWFVRLARPFVPLCHRQLKRLPEQGDGGLDISRFLDVETHPASLWQYVMWLGATRVHYLITYFLGKGDV